MARVLNCPYCGDPAKLVLGADLYPHRDDLAARIFWRCAPCDAHVGCHQAGTSHVVNGERIVHKGDEPFGRLANATLRKLKQQVHSHLDIWWKAEHKWRRHPAYTPKPRYPGARRNEVYAWLSKELGLDSAETHVGMFDEAQCHAALAVLQRLEQK